MTITLCDASEFQENIDAPAYLASNHTCLIVRAHNGRRPDNKWPARRDYLRRFSFDALGFYQYLVADRPAVEQARDFISAVGGLRFNEFVVLDCEEGFGDQVARAQAWFAVVDARYGAPSALYSGEAFGDDNLGGWAHWAGRPRWIAAYRRVEPNAPHDLWQFADAVPFPGIGICDGNLFHGTAQQFTETFCGTAPPPLPKPIKEGTVISSAVKSDGRIELFYEAEDGEVLHTWQSAPNSGWAGAEKGKRYAGWQSMGKPQQARM
jgi:GH25 family lysozyme M1 (1,4-beta-N-acetylmuramidase)